MRSFTTVVALAAIVAAASAVSVRTAKKDKDYYKDYKMYNLREKTVEYEKCAGEKGYPYVHYAPCPKGYMCAKKASYADYEWGLYCIPIPKGYAPKCYEDKARCMGAKDKPYVPYYPCCSKGSVCAEMPDWGYGSFCIAKGYDYKEPETYEMEKYVEKKYADVSYGVCHKTGFKCKGEKGYPYFEYGDGCCSKYDECIVDKEYGEWGGYCVTVYEEEDDYAVHKKYGYPMVEEKKDSYGHKYWGKKDEYDEKCINTGYYGCEVVAHNEFYYRQAVTRMAKGYKECCKATDICYKGYCKAKKAVPFGFTNGMKDGKKVVKPKKKIPFPVMSPPALW